MVGHLWIPAFAGMTGVEIGNDGVKIGRGCAIIPATRRDKIAVWTIKT